MKIEWAARALAGYPAANLALNACDSLDWTCNLRSGLDSRRRCRHRCVSRMGKERSG